MANSSVSSYKFVLYISKIYSIPIFRPLVEYLNETEHSFRFFISSKVNLNFPQEWDRKKISNSLSEAKQFKPDFVLVSGNFVDFRIPGIKVQLFHGLGVEKEAHFTIRHFFDVYLTSGPYVTERFNKLKSRYNYFIIRETGWPKIDYIVNFPTKKIEKLNLPHDKKIILYAPTFSKDHQSASELLDYIPGIIKEDEFWLLKFHELMNKEAIKKSKAITGNNVKVLDNIEITPYLHAADLLISDTSSVIYEFMVLDKPIITYRTKGAKDKGIDIENPGQLREAIDRCLNNPNEFKNERVKHIKLVNPNLDGNISKRVISDIIDIKSQNALRGKKKPLNIFRKTQIIYHSIFKKGYLR